MEMLYYGLHVFLIFSDSEAIIVVVSGYKKVASRIAWFRYGLSYAAWIFYPYSSNKRNGERAAGA
jgi:hypothetical protein